MAYPVPHSASVPFTLADGTEIIIKGVVNPNCSRFNINLCSGPNYNQGETALHFNPRFSQNEVIRTHNAGGWGNEEKHGGFPFQRGTPYEVKFVVKNHAYQIFVNNAYFTDFNHRLPKETVRFVYIEGETQLNGVTFSNAIQNPPVPFTTPIPGGIYPGRRITVSGIPTGGSRFNVNLLCGPSFDANDIALHFDARFNFGASQNQVVRTHRAGGGWGAEEKGQNYFPFTPNAPFEMVIVVEQFGFVIMVNNQAFANFNHRIQPFQQVNFLNIQGDVRLTQVKV